MWQQIVFKDHKYCIIVFSFPIILKRGRSSTSANLSNPEKKNNSPEELQNSFSKEPMTIVTGSEFLNRQSYYTLKKIS